MLLELYLNTIGFPFVSITMGSAIDKVVMELLSVILATIPFRLFLFYSVCHSILDLHPLL